MRVYRQGYGYGYYRPGSSVLMTDRYAYPRPDVLQFGQAPPLDEKEQEERGVRAIKSALGSITPTLILVGIATGAAFAIGSGLVHRYVFKERR